MTSCGGQVEMGVPEKGVPHSRLGEAASGWRLLGVSDWFALCPALSEPCPGHRVSRWEGWEPQQCGGRTAAAGGSGMVPERSRKQGLSRRAAPELCGPRYRNHTHR